MLRHCAGAALPSALLQSAASDLGGKFGLLICALLAHDLQNISAARPPRQGLLSHCAGLYTDSSSTTPYLTQYIQKQHVGNEKPRSSSRKGQSSPTAAQRRVCKSQMMESTRRQRNSAPANQSLPSTWGKASSAGRWRASQNAPSSLDLPSLVINAGK